MKENKTLKNIRLQKNSINMNFLDAIQKYIERNNLFMLENNVNELKHDREGYLLTRKKAWEEVYETRFKQHHKAAKLEKLVETRKSQKAKLITALQDEHQDLANKIKHYRSMTWDVSDGAEKFGQELRRIEKDYEKQVEDNEHSYLQAKKMIEL
jgi:CHASE3 domain sensor protein